MFAIQKTKKSYKEPSTPNASIPALINLSSLHSPNAVYSITQGLTEGLHEMTFTTFFFP